MNPDIKVHQECLMHEALERTLKSHCNKWKNLDRKVNWIFILLIVNLALLVVELFSGQILSERGWNYEQSVLESWVEHYQQHVADVNG